jgi:hypothetical protein
MGVAPPAQPRVVGVAPPARPRVIGAAPARPPVIGAAPPARHSSPDGPRQSPGYSFSMGA